ncbi:hypothetical protein GCM10009830_26570 [Glycomyces endophyticus]|uniref:Gram-positive cocci surface proteins LPxTG domain-containing protein n=1 Tax=Glycomyces endophyticus TaxID=480996 RepID=A0ABP4SWJ2_9ACTN
MRLDVDAPDATVYFGNGPGCDSPDNTPFIECETADPGTATTFTFTIAAATGTALGDYDYTLTLLLDGAEIHSETGVVEVVEGRDDGVFRDFTTEDLTYTGVEPGTALDVNPHILQNSAYPESVDVIGVYFGNPAGVGAPNGGAHLNPAWDNCMVDIWISGSGYFCFFTEFEDLPGTVLQFSQPFVYTVDEDAPGPLAVCACSYHIWGMSEDDFAADFAGPWWEPDSSNLLSLVTADDQDAPAADDDPSYGSITIETTENPYDLAVEGADLSGGEVQVTIPVENLGPAGAINRAISETEPGYQLRGQLPEGAEFVSVDNEGDGHWFCESGDLSDLYEAAGVETELDRFDFVCSFWTLEPGESHEFTVTLDVGDATGEPGKVEVDARYRGVDGVNLDGDLANNTAALTVDGRSLPNTGTSIITFVAIAAGAVVLGIVLFLLTRRRKDSDGTDAENPVDPSNPADSA